MNTPNDEIDGIIIEEHRPFAGGMDVGKHPAWGEGDGWHFLDLRKIGWGVRDIREMSEEEKAKMHRLIKERKEMMDLTFVEMGVIVDRNLFTKEEFDTLRIVYTAFREIHFVRKMKDEVLGRRAEEGLALAKIFRAAGVSGEGLDRAEQNLKQTLKWAGKIR